MHVRPTLFNHNYFLLGDRKCFLLNAENPAISDGILLFPLPDQFRLERHWTLRKSLALISQGVLLHRVIYMVSVIGGSLVKRAGKN